MISGVENSGDATVQQPTPATARRLVLLGLIPMLGVLLFGIAGALGLRAFSHNNSLNCGFGSLGGGSACSHYSYALPVAVGVGGLLLLIGGGALASYYAMRNVGLPLFSALRNRTVRR